MGGGEGEGEGEGEVRVWVGLRVWLVEGIAVRLHLHRHTLVVTAGREGYVRTLLWLYLLWLCLLWPCLHGHVGELDELNLVVLVLVGDVEQLLDALLVS